MWLEEIEETERNLDLSELKDVILAKSLDSGFHFNYVDKEFLGDKILVIRIPLERLENKNFEFGLAHELTEATLRKIILSIMKDLDLKHEPNLWEMKYLIHEATILSIERYSFVSQAYDVIENDLKNTREEKLNKLPASQKKKFLALESQMNSKSSRTSILSRIKLWIRQYKPF